MNEDEQQQQQQWRSLLINHAEIWTETPPSSSSVGGNNNNRAVLRLHEVGGPAQSSRTKKSCSRGNTPHKVGEEKGKESNGETGKFGKD